MDGGKELGHRLTCGNDSRFFFPFWTNSLHFFLLLLLLLVTVTEVEDFPESLMEDHRGGLTCFSPTFSLVNDWKKESATLDSFVQFCNTLY